MLCFDAGNTCGIESAHLASTHATCLSIGTKHNRIAFDELRDFPCKQQVLQLLSSRLHIGNHFEIRELQFMIVGGLHQ